MNNSRYGQFMDHGGLEYTSQQSEQEYYNHQQNYNSDADPFTNSNKNKESKTPEEFAWFLSDQKKNMQTSYDELQFTFNEQTKSNSPK